MSYRGLMDGWHGDEYGCDGDCGMCDACQNIREQQGENDYEAWREEQIEKQISVSIKYK